MSEMKDELLHMSGPSLYVLIDGVANYTIFLGWQLVTLVCQRDCQESFALFFIVLSMVMISLLRHVVIIYPLLNRQRFIDVCRSTLLVPVSSYSIK